MTDLIVGLIVIIAGPLLSLKILALWSRKRSAAAYGIIDGKLAPCPGSPNCSCTEDTNAAVRFTVESSMAWAELLQVLKSMGGETICKNDHYIHATFKSKSFGFIEDLEARLDRSEQVIHLRSANRVGYSDFGSSRERIGAIQKWMEE